MHVIRTMKQDSKRGHYYIPEDRKLLRYLREIRSRNIVEEHPVRPKYHKNNYKGKKQRRGDR